MAVTNAVAARTERRSINRLFCMGHAPSRRIAQFVSSTSSSPAAEAGVAGPYDRLRPAVDAKLGEYDRHLITDRLLANAKLARNGGVVETLGDALKHLVLAGGEPVEQCGDLAGRRFRQEGVERREEVLPGRFAGQQDMIAAFKQHKSRALDETRQQPAFLERNHRILTAVQDKGRTADLRRDVTHVGAHKGAKQPNCVRRRGREAQQLVVWKYLLRRRVRDVHRRKKP